MNSFYHEFEIGFNHWYIILPVVLVLAAVLGSKRYYLEPETMKIRKRGKKLSNLNFVAVVLSDMAVTTLIALESSNGVIQFFTNLLTRNDSPTWGLIMAAIMLIIGVPCVVFVLIVNALKVGEYYQLGRLTDYRHKNKKTKTLI